MAHVPFTSNHVPHMREDLLAVQRGANAGCGRNRFFFLATNNGAFAHKALKKLVDKGEVEIRCCQDGNVLAKFTDFVPDNNQEVK